MRIREWLPKQLEILVLGLLSQTFMLINDVEGPHRLLPWSSPQVCRDHFSLDTSKPTATAGADPGWHRHASMFADGGAGQQARSASSYLIKECSLSIWCSRRRRSESHSRRRGHHCSRRRKPRLGSRGSCGMGHRCSHRGWALRISQRVGQRFSSISRLLTPNHRAHGRGHLRRGGWRRNGNHHPHRLAPARGGP